MADVIILMASNSDLPVVEQCFDLLKEYGVSAEMHIASPHRSPAALYQLVTESEAAGAKVFIAASGGSAHLAGSTAAMTNRPVIGLPLSAGALGGVDALYSTVNMPPGVPVATVSVGVWGARNAALLATQMLAIGDETLAEKVKEVRAANTEKSDAKEADLQARLNGEQPEAN